MSSDGILSKYLDIQKDVGKSTAASWASGKDAGTFLVDPRAIWLARRGPSE